MVNGLFAGRMFPKPDACQRLYNLLTRGEGVLQGRQVPVWVYQNMGSSSFFNDLFRAAENFLGMANPATTQCGICETTPCLALADLPPFWIAKMRDPDNATPHALRYRCYKECHPRSGYARIPLHDCWLLAIRLCHPGGDITGFRPRYIKAAPVAVPVVILPAPGDQPVLGDQQQAFQVVVPAPAAYVQHADENEEGEEDEEDTDDSDEEWDENAHVNPEEIHLEDPRSRRRR